jgi:hypothetical protein
MYCCKCGTKIVAEAAFCHKCGQPVYAEGEVVATQTQSPQGPSERTPDSALMRELASIDKQAHCCHACGKKDQLLSWDFGLGKPIGTKREWAKTAVSVAVSAVTIPLLGAGMLQLPGTSTRLSVLPLKLVLCSDCHKSKKSYDVHPWWAPLRRYGYTEFVSAQALKTLR